MLDEQYAAIEEKTAAFGGATGIGCPPGCGECCTAIDFPVSRPEARRVAEFLLATPPALERFESRPIEDPRRLGRKVSCPFYDADNGEAHCTVYVARPLLCRTFAFSARREKDGVAAYAPCHRFRETPESEARVARARDESRAGCGPALPILPDESMVVWSLDPCGPIDVMPMGPAVASEVAVLAMRRAFSGPERS